MAAATRRRRKQTRRSNGLLKIWRGKKAKLGRRRVVTAAAATHRKDWRLVVGGELKEMAAAAPYPKTQQQRSARTFKRGLHASLEIRPRRCDRSGAGGWVGETHLRPLLASESRQANETLSSPVTWRGETTRFQAGGPVAAIPSSQSARLSVGRSETSEARPRSRGRRSDLLVTPGGALHSIVERRYFARWRFVDWCLRRRNAACLVVEVGRVGEAGAVKDDLSEADAGLGIAAWSCVQKEGSSNCPDDGDQASRWMN